MSEALPLKKNTSSIMAAFLHHTYLAASIPHGHWVVVGGVSSGARWVDPTELVHIVMDVGGSYENTLNHQ